MSSIPIGAHRGGLINTTQSYPNSTTGFTNTTPRMAPMSGEEYNGGSVGGDVAGNFGIDIDNNKQQQSYNSFNAHNNNNNNNNNTHTTQDVKRLETIVDRIVRRAGPPQSSLGNPGPLGLASFAATTFMLSCWNADLLVSTTENVVLPMALWYGGISQVLAGMWEFAAQNTFGATAFTSYGAFWLSFATLNEFWAPSGYASTADMNAAVGMYLLAWAIFTLYMLVASLRMSWSLVAVFFFLDITFALLAGANFITTPYNADLVKRAGGWFGIITAFAAWYASAAVVINGTYGCQILPVGVVGPLHAHSSIVKHVPALQRRLTTHRIEASEVDNESSGKQA